MTASRAAHWPRPAGFGLVGVLVLSLGFVGVGPAVAAGAVGSVTTVPVQAASVSVPVAVQTGRTKPRAWVTAVLERQASGAVRVSVSSNARKVKITFRTAKNKKRSATIRVRAGQGSKYLPGGSNKVFVQARRTSKLRASRRVAAVEPAQTPPPTTPVGTTPPPTTTATQPTVWRDDADGNGTLDYVIDMESDGYYEAILIDDNVNGRFEIALVYAALTSGILFDQNEDGYFEIVGIDANRDTIMERVFYDADSDGYPEQQYLDLIGPDGVADTWVVSTASTGTQQENESANDMMVQHIVTMQQMRQLDPWSTGYIHYNSTPSLLRDGYSSSCLQCRRW